jgi:uncharacterized protein YqkB
MKIIWTPEAAAEAKRRFGPAAVYWKLAYDTEGCGCAVNGVPALWAVDRPGPGERLAESAPYAVAYDPAHAVFFDETLTLSYDAGRRSFALASDSQIYTRHLRIEDRRSEAALR